MLRGRELTDVTFQAVVQRVSTLADGGLRVTFDLPEDAILQAAELMAFKREEVALAVSVSMVSALQNSEMQRDDKRQALEAGPKRKSEWKSAKE